MMRPLTDRQQQVLDFVSSYRDERGYCVTVREIGDRFGLSTAGVMRHLNAMRKKRAVTWENGQARTLRPTGRATDGTPQQ